MLVGEGLVEAAGEFRHPDASDLLDLRRVGEPGDVPHDRSQVDVRSTDLKLKAIEEIVPPVGLDVGGSERTGAAVQLRIFDVPGIDHLRLPGILDADDVEADRGAPRAGLVRVVDVDVWARQLLL